MIEFIYFVILFSFFFFYINSQRSIFYVEGKESQKDILRLRQLESTLSHENGSTSFASASVSSNNTLNESDTINSKLEQAIEQNAFGIDLPMQTLIEHNTTN